MENAPETQGFPLVKTGLVAIGVTAVALLGQAVYSHFWGSRASLARIEAKLGIGESKCGESK